MILETLEGEQIKLDGLIPLGLRIESLAPRHTIETLDGRDGAIDLGTNYEPRRLHGRFAMIAHDFTDYSLLRSDIFRLFDAKKYFYIIDKNSKHKRWKVKTSMPFTPQRLSRSAGEFEVEFISYFPFAESRGTTLDPFTFETDMWQLGQGLISDDLIYTHNTTSFRIYNGSDIDVDPRQVPIKINYQGASNNLKILNTTTYDEWAYSGSSEESDTILLDGVRSLKNDQSIFKDTNKKLITLQKGWNDFTLIGTSGSFLISFEFRFYTN